MAKLAGWAYYGMNKMDQAVAEWKRSLALRADPEVQAALDKAQRDKQEEESYKENESTHFTLRYSGAAEPELARDVLRTLEAHFSEIESELDFTPPDSIGVVLYTQQAFADITRAPGWVGALNDGRIRVPVQGLTSMTPELSRVLKHELTHSFVGQKTRGRAPTWIQEGLAQWMEGKRSGDNADRSCRFFSKDTQLRSAVSKGRGWVCRMIRPRMRTRGRLPTWNILCRRMAWAIWNEFLTAIRQRNFDGRGAARMCCDYATDNGFSHADRHRREESWRGWN